MLTRQKKLLIIGGITWSNTERPKIGGTTVLLDNFIEYCVTCNVPHVVIPTNKYHSKFAGILNLIFIFFSFLKYAKRDDVAMVNVSSKSGLITLFPFVVILGKFFRLEVVCRKFAGSIHLYLEKHNFRKRIALFFLKHTKVSFFETEELIKWFERNGLKAVWFPNVRKESKYRVSKIYDKKLVFLAQIYEDKGIDILLRISNLLPDSYTIDIYGPITDSKYTDYYFNQYKVHYKGVLKPEEVAKTIANYNVLVFPTWWHSEGYPGVIIEAYSVGMPVISTFQGGIPEMVADGVSGLLTPVKDEEAFNKSILSINQTKYEELCKGAEKRFELYNSEIVNPYIVSLMMK